MDRIIWVVHAQTHSKNNKRVQKVTHAKIPLKILHIKKKKKKKKNWIFRACDERKLIRTTYSFVDRSFLVGASGRRRNIIFQFKYFIIFNSEIIRDLYPNHRNYWDASMYIVQHIIIWSRNFYLAIGLWFIMKMPLRELHIYSLKK